MRTAIDAMSARAPSRLRSDVAERPSRRGPRTARRARRRARASGGRPRRARRPLPPAGTAGVAAGAAAGVIPWATRQTLPSSAMARRSLLPADRCDTSLASRRGRRSPAPRPSRSRAWLVIVSRTSRRSLRPVSWRATGVQGLALPLPPVEVGDGEAQLGGAGDLARDVRGTRPPRCPARRAGGRRGAGGRSARRRGSAAGPGCPCRPRSAGRSAVRRSAGPAPRPGSAPIQARPGDRVAGRRIDDRLLADRDRDDAREGAGLGHDAVERLLEEVRQGEAAPDRRAHRVGDREVLVLGDELLLRPVEVEGDDRREQDDRAAR